MTELWEYIRVALSWYRWMPPEEVYPQDIESFKKLECYMRRHMDK